MDPIKIWRAIRRNYTDYGIAVTAGKLFKTLLSPVYENYTYRIYCIDLNNIKKTEKKIDKRFEVRRVQYGDTDIIIKIESMAEWLQGQVKEKLHHGHICVAALDSGNLAGFNLISLKEGYIPLLKKKWRLADEEAWSEQITVGRSYRRQGLGLALRNKAFEELLGLGKSRFCGGALISNRKSLGLARRAGYRFTEDMQYIKIFGYKKWHRREVTE